ncbi:MAG: SpoIIE family protein phosphatase [Spirochaetes bacterium]|nr:SpoIIE family protein phosphatase [Spirochaetota bacterium]
MNDAAAKGSEKSGKPAKGTGKAEKQTKADRKKGEKGIRFGIRIKFSLAIISLVSIIIVTITAYFVWRETGLLKDQIFQLVEREIVHLSKTASGSIGIDELAMLTAMQDLRKIPYFKYAYILDKEDSIQQYFDLTKKQKIGEKLIERFDRTKGEKRGGGKIFVVRYADPEDTKGVIYDFSKLVPSPINDQISIGKVIIGFSDKVIRDEVWMITQIIVLISLAFLGISIVGSVVLTSIIIKPIKELSRGATIIGQGNLDHRINIKTSDELGRLAKEFNVMTSMIKDAKEKEIESRVMEEQLEMAKDIQEGLNPMEFYEKKGVEIKGFTRAAKGVGGDYFDYIDIDDNRVGALISDVSGKGVPASLVMVMIRTVFTSYITRKDIDCSRVVTAINDSLSADFAIDKFATLFFMIYDRKTEELSFANAGHGPLFCYRSSKKTCTVTKVDGTPIGIMEDVEYKQAKVRLNQGDIVVMYTDGITEMRNENREEYGLRRVQDLLLANSEKSANDLVEMIVNDVDTFRGGARPHDDMTLLVFKRVE